MSRFNDDVLGLRATDDSQRESVHATNIDASPASADVGRQCTVDAARHLRLLPAAGSTLPREVRDRSERIVLAFS